MESHGEIDRRPATWRYERTQVDKVGRLSWAEGHVPSSDSQWSHIQFDCIIAIVQVDFRESNEYRLLYVSEVETAAEKSASPVLFKTITVSNPPDGLVQDFQPANSASFYSRLIREGLSPNIHVIVSTGSGTGKAADVWERLLKPFLDHICEDTAGKSYQLHFTESETSIADLTRTIFLPRADEGIAQSIILLSGDGGLVDIANTLVSEPLSATYQKPDVAILPLGTGNSMAHSSGITKDKTLGLSTLIRGSPKEVPLFRASFSPGSRLLANEAREERELPTSEAKATCHGAVVCSWGLHAGLVADSDTAHYRQFGAERFQMAAKEALYPSDGSPPHPYRGKLSILRPGASEWQRVDRDEHAYVLATLCSHLEASFHISPTSQRLDGKLRLVHFGPMSGDEVMQLMTAAYQDGKHVQDARVGYEEIEGLKIEFDETDARWRRVCVDGKIIRVEQAGWVEVKVGGGEGLVDLIAM